MTDLYDKLRKVGFRLGHDALDAFLRNAARRKSAHTEALEELCTLEMKERETINFARRVRMATLGSFKNVDQFDWNHPRSIPRDLYEQLCDLVFIKHAHNVLFRGQSGVGKTTLARNLGHLALAKGYKVRFTPLADMLADLLRQESVPAFDRRLRRYIEPHLLIIDELGYLPADSKAADTLYHVINRRHETRSTIITTNLAYKQWTTVFPNASCVGALVDRFAHHCHNVDIDAESWRHKEAESLKKKPRRNPDD